MFTMIYLSICNDKLKFLIKEEKYDIFLFTIIY